MNNYTRNCKKWFEDFYTEKEIELNNKLYRECKKKKIDLLAVEELLRQGADPMGPAEDMGGGIGDHIYEELVAASQDTDSINLPKITELFLRYGMEVDHPRVSYDVEDDTINPLWSFAFVTNENAIHALKMLLDSGVSADSVGEFWGHAIGDYQFVDEINPINDIYWKYQCTWTLKMIMLAASYDQIIDNDQYLRELICYSDNSYDIHGFREWDNYRYEFDLSGCDSRPHIFGSVVRIYEEATNEKVWEMKL